VTENVPVTVTRSAFGYTETVSRVAEALERMAALLGEIAAEAAG
jgi:hypothetical protein